MLVFSVLPAAAGLIDFKAEELVRVGGVILDVPGYSVPSFFDITGDGLNDLIVGEGGGGYAGYVRIYENVGTVHSPLFTSYQYAQSNGLQLTCAASGCMGCFPRVLDWDNDSRNDLVIGQADGTIKRYFNIGTATDPTFDGGGYIQVGAAGSKLNIDVGDRAAPTMLDWNNDGKKDLVVGSLAGNIRLYINEGTDAAPDFLLTDYVKKPDNSTLTVVTGRSSPSFVDLDGDGMKDLLAGNTEGQQVFFSNLGTDTAPRFSTYSLVQSAGVTIDLGGATDARSRQFVCDWTGDGVWDLLVGSSDGQVHLFQGVPEPGTLALLGITGMAIGLMRLRYRSSRAFGVETQ
jgi:hypothetical protein